MIEFDPDREQDPAWPEFDDINDEQYAALWERFELSGSPEADVRAFANACFQAGQAQGYNDRVVHIPFRGEQSRTPP